MKPKTKSTGSTKAWGVTTGKMPKIKRVDEDCWSVAWGGFTTEFLINLCGDPVVSVYPDGERCFTYFDSRSDTRLLLPMPPTESVMTFYKREEVKPMAGKKKKVMTKEEGKECKKKDYYAGKEVKAQ